MLIAFEDRPSDSPVIDRVWRSHSERAGNFRSMATCNWVMVVSRHQGKTFLTIRGPETRATEAECPADGEWIGIHFRPGSFMPLFMPGELRDRKDATLPDTSRRCFRLDSSAWEYPTFDNAEVFVQRLLKRGLIVADPRIERMLRGMDPLSQRSRQRHFLKATGMTLSTFRQIERARHATLLLKEGTSISQAIGDTGYFDQAHLTRSLKHFVGLTPTQIARGEEQLSLLYKTDTA